MCVCVFIIRIPVFGEFAFTLDLHFIISKCLSFLEAYIRRHRHAAVCGAVDAKTCLSSNKSNLFY